MSTGYDADSTVMRRTGFDAQNFADSLKYWQTDWIEFAELPFLAFGLLGEPARIRHNMARDRFVGKLGKGSKSAEGMARAIENGSRAYDHANDAAIEALIVRANKWFDSAGPGVREPLTSAGSVLTDEGYDAGRYVFDQQRRAFPMGQFGSFGAMAGFGGLVAIASTSAQRGRQVAALLATGGRISLAAASAFMIWAHAMSHNDDEIDSAVMGWTNAAERLSGRFGAGDPLHRAELTTAWSGEAKDVADRKLRDFLTAGIQLADSAASKAVSLAEVVKLLNHLADMAFKVAAVQIPILLALGLYAAFNPTAWLAKERVGRTITISILMIQALIAGVYSGRMWAAMDEDEAASRRDGVPATDFPVIA
ncbi:hypothetical protein GBF35_44660 [Nonomuraea phyllanthi]|uniref:hypothetical protein n=1 Tax=Nonomuraea phyllanthi TaxID=2219224 RepID=UPI001293C5BE|nr:hypothetical protein [Nonomuraea phyllanthi]QFY12727.1 hypothetical protein GBF35_44660 [Nonomuraea phyllanthi]